MAEFFRRLFTSDFLPHGTCYLWNPAVLWLNVMSDGLIALSYYAIPVLLFLFARKRKDLTFHWIFVAFGIFILACGTTHLLGVWTVWHATYRLDGIVKAFTAIASLTTAGLMIPLFPRLVGLPKPQHLARLSELLASESQERDEATKILLQQAGLLDLAYDAIMVRRSDGTLVFWNRGAETMYGWPKSEALGRVSHDLLKTRLPEPIECIRGHLAEAGRWEGELIHTTRDGRTVIVASRWASRRGDDGQLEILEINTDITQQKGAEERLRDLNQRLEQRVIERTAELRRSNDQLRESMDRYRFLAESMPQIVWTTKANGTMGRIRTGIKSCTLKTCRWPCKSGNRLWRTVPPTTSSAACNQEMDRRAGIWCAPSPCVPPTGPSSSGLALVLTLTTRNHPPNCSHAPIGS